MEYDTIIIGSGVAGLTAALYLARAKKKVMIIENSVLGGTVASLDIIENYPGIESITGFDLVQNLIKQISQLGVNIDFLNINSIDYDNKKVICDNISLQYKTLIIASGSSYVKLNLPEEDKFKFRGLSYCAVCDGNLYKDKDIVIITNGYSGASSVNYLSNISNKITIIDISDQYNNENYNVIKGAFISKILGESFVSGVEIIVDNELQQVKCDAIFVALGKKTDLSLYENAIHNDEMYILSDEDMHTNINGVFVAGDIRKKNLRQIVTACSDGAIAGSEAIKYLNNI